MTHSREVADLVRQGWSQDLGLLPLARLRHAFQARVGADGGESEHLADRCGGLPGGDVQPEFAGAEAGRTARGYAPLRSADGSELFYRGASKVMSVGATAIGGSPQPFPVVLHWPVGLEL